MRKDDGDEKKIWRWAHVVVVLEVLQVLIFILAQ